MKKISEWSKGNPGSLIKPSIKGFDERWWGSSRSAKRPFCPQAPNPLLVPLSSDFWLRQLQIAKRIKVLQLSGNKVAGNNVQFIEPSCSNAIIFNLQTLCFPNAH